MTKSFDYSYTGTDNSCEWSMEPPKCLVEKQFQANMFSIFTKGILFQKI